MTPEQKIKFYNKKIREAKADLSACNAGFDSEESVVRELVLWTNNDAVVYEKQLMPIWKNMARKMASGRFDPELAVKSFMYAVESGAKSYVREFGDASTPWYEMFPKNVRLMAAQELLEEFMAEAEVAPETFEPMVPKKHLTEWQKRYPAKEADLNPSYEDMQESEFDSFFNAYMETALWSSHDESDDSGGNPMDENYSTGDIADECYESMKADCRKFFKENYEVMDEADGPSGPDYDEWGHMGHDFWLTRNGHGAGFWDGDYSEPHGDLLDEAAKSFGEIDLYIGDDNTIHCYNG